MKLVCVAPHLPYYGIDHAGGDYLLEYLRCAVNLGWDVTIICPASSGNLNPHGPVLMGLRATYGRKEHTNKLAKAARLIRRGVNTPPFRSWHRTLGEDALKALDGADIIDLQWMGCVAYASGLRRLHPHALIVATPHDVKSESVQRAASSPNPLLRVVARLALPAVSRTETASLSCVDMIFVFKRADIETLRGKGIHGPISLTPPLVRLQSGHARPNPDARRVVFAAAFWREENDEGARWFLEKVWPLVRERQPDARARFAGSRPSAWLLSNVGPDIEVTGYLANLDEAYHDVTAAVAPLQRGAGLKFKVVQAMAMGFPIIGTSVANEGMNELVGDHAVINHDSPDDFARAIVDVLKSAPRAISTAQQTAEDAQSKFDFPSRIREQFSSYERALRHKLSESEAPRSLVSDARDEGRE